MLSWLLPRICPICGAVVSANEMLCRRCTINFPVEPVRLPFMTVGTTQIWCAAVYPYRGQVREAIQKFKFNGQRGRAEGFGRLMAAQLSAKVFDVITFVPMDRIKQLERGYNQAQLLAQECGKSTGLPVQALLYKTRSTGTQHELKAAERAANASHAYSAKPLHGERIVLCDDIVTTGATLRACAQALLAAGASEIFCICTAWTKGEL